ncbi:unnamed protein product [Litomosoides sigmodontis]|uniref:Uncharacterized protein n=1 Tax=Litomosoides sigmodontis TaxID=42156 RepID=A0A3P6UBU2_LITSI|nr:unnamed protein product [Litomosoides sigmodontis]
MGGISKLLENSIFIGYCVYRTLIAFHLVATNVKFASDNYIRGWAENHIWPEIEIALAVMAIVGLLSGRRFLFGFTVLFFVFRTTIGITATTIDLYIISSGKSISCATSEHSTSYHLSRSCKWVDAFILIQNALTLVSLILISTVLFLRLFYFTSEPHDPIDPIEQNFTARRNRSPKIPFFVGCEKRKDDANEHKYNITFNDNPYKSSVI